MRKEEQPIVEPVAFLVANATIPHEPVKAKGWSNEPFPAFYPADRESDAQEAARILRAVCEPLYPASALEALQAEIERLKGERDRWEKHATTGDGVLERTGAKLTTAESEASALRELESEIHDAHENSERAFKGLTALNAAAYILGRVQRLARIAGEGTE